MSIIFRKDIDRVLRKEEVDGNFDYLLKLFSQLQEEIKSQKSAAAKTAHTESSAAEIEGTVEFKEGKLLLKDEKNEFEATPVKYDSEGRFTYFSQDGFKDLPVLQMQGDDLVVVLKEKVMRYKDGKFEEVPR